MSPQTTTAINFCDAVIKLDNQGGGLVDISGSSNDVTMDLQNKLGEAFTYSSKFPVRKECKKDATINLKVVYSQADQEAMDLLLDWYYNTFGSKTITVDTPNSDPGGDRFTFEVFLESLNMPGKSDDANPTLCTAVLKPTGSFTRAIIGS